MTPDILFDNFIIANDKYVADKFAADRYFFFFNFYCFYKHNADLPT